MKKTLLTLFALIFTSLMLFSSPAAETTESTTEESSTPITIGISQLIAHPALDQITQGIQDYLDQQGVNYTVDVQIANGEVATCAQIAQLFKDNNYDYVVGVATPTAQALANFITDKPIVYATVTDPDAAGLSGIDTICGTTDQPPVAAHLELIQEITGGIKSLGMLYTSIEANGISLMESMKAAAEAAGVEFVTQAVNNSSEVKAAAQAIADRVDAIYIGTDNTVISAINGVADVCLEYGIPLVTADTTSSFGTNVLLSGGFNYYNSGLQTGRMLYDIINGASPKDLGMEYVEQEEIYVNLDVAKQLGITIPDDILSEAVYVIENGVDIKAQAEG